YSVPEPSGMLGLLVGGGMMMTFISRQR
ncbi:MAG: PEP-CTERM sorting domain-containing protein, partial [Planctomycetales bacterium]|nr:PEP-CTERM sorting domain-containing protein [Planctomycetales bacterium]